MGTVPDHRKYVRMLEYRGHSPRSLIAHEDAGQSQGVGAAFLAGLRAGVASKRRSSQFRVPRSTKGHQLIAR